MEMELIKKIRKENAEAKKKAKDASIQRKQELYSFESKLILEVESHKSIYDKTCKEYKNRNIKASDWQEISIILAKSVPDCQKKWITLRDTFSSNLKASTITVSGSASTPTIKWHHFDSMKFLIPFVKIPNNNCGNYYSSANENIALEDEVEQNMLQLFGEVPSTEIMEPEPSWNESSCSIETLKEPNRSSTKRKRHEEKDDAFSKILQAIENIPADPPQDSSPMTNFFASLNGLTSHFTREQQIDFQVGCLNLIKEIDKRAIN